MSLTDVGELWYQFPEENILTKDEDYAVNGVIVQQVPDVTDKEIPKDTVFIDKPSYNYKIMKPIEY